MLLGEVWEAAPDRLFGFNGHPPLGVNATCVRIHKDSAEGKFQWAPTLGGECYSVDDLRARLRDAFQWAPTLGGECYSMDSDRKHMSPRRGFNGHPPLGVNAT